MPSRHSEPTGTSTSRWNFAAIAAGISDTSSSRLLTDRIVQSTIDSFHQAGEMISGSILEIAPLATDIARTLTSGFPTKPVSEAMTQMANADLLIAVMPVYKAGMSGLFKSSVDLLDNDSIIAKPVILGATAGTGRHSMVVDEQMRPLFAFMRALPVPTSIFAAPDDWKSPGLGERINRATSEGTALTMSGATAKILENSWSDYQHQFASSATHSHRTAQQTDFTTDLMRLAAGGGANTPNYSEE